MFEIDIICVSATATPGNEIVDPDVGLTLKIGAGLEHVRLYEYGPILPAASLVV